MNFEFDLPYIIVITIFSCVGFVYFSFGKKMNYFFYMIAGLSLMGYGYVCDGWIQAGVWGVILSIVPFVASQFWGA